MPSISLSTILKSNRSSTSFPAFPFAYAHHGSAGSSHSTYRAACNASRGGDRVLAGQKNKDRETVINLLHQLSHYVLMVAFGDRNVVLESGFTPTKEPETVLVTNPTNIKVTYTGQPGELLVSVKPVKGAASYMFEYTTNPEMNEGDWQRVHCTAARCKVKGLTPGATYFLRVGVIGTKEQVLYSQVLTKMAV